MSQQSRIIKINVAKGIFWVEIPAADLRVLCGAPMDSVKHLMKRGLIVETEKSGIRCESGPNAILLCDTMLQHGEFSNLGEFPVLQMLYRQGLILPEHPNNTGEKPLLIGSAEQVNAQMQYIYRGNYGLVSKEEIMACGIDEKRAAEMMRLKLRFAFGVIRPTQELLDPCIIGNEACPIRNGVTIRRLATNLFEFVYKDETVMVDLNLAENENYESAYPLSFQRLPREYFGVIHSGSGDGWDINRPSMSSVLMFQGKIYLIDAGPNLFNNLAALGIGLDEIEGVFHTHAHDDHFCGITTLMQAGHKIKYYATALVRTTVQKKVAALLSIDEELFADFFDICDLDAEAWNDIEGLEVKPIYSPHPLETTIFIFRTLWDEGFKSYAHFADIASFAVLHNMIEENPAKPGISRDYFEKIKADYLTPVDIKKLDVGGGLIHGAVEDFKDDQSARILLAHTAHTLTPAEKEVGSDAPYGMTDILIRGESDFIRRNAFDFLRSALPQIPRHYLRILLNNPVASFNPGTILLKEGELPTTVFLILTGAVERIRTADHILSRLSGGAMLGDICGQANTPSTCTYTTASYVRALKIPLPLYTELVSRNKLEERIERNWENLSFLESTPLFAEGIAHPILNQLADSLHCSHFSAGSTINLSDQTHITIIKTGRIRRSLGNETIDILESKGHFGEEEAVFGTPGLFSFEALDEVELLQVSGALIKDIPIVRWKLFESYLKRTVECIRSSEESGELRWNCAFNLNIIEMDIQHKKILSIANTIIDILHSNKERSALARALKTFLQYSRYHFNAEEVLMKRYAYPQLVQHRAAHKKLLEQINSYRQMVEAQMRYEEIDFQSFFTNWIIKHILDEDHRYGIFLREKGIY